jgi:hypothetical protein
MISGPLDNPMNAPRGWRLRRLAPERRLRGDDRRKGRGAAKLWVCRLSHVAEVPLVRPPNRIPRSIAPEACHRRRRLWKGTGCGRRALCRDQGRGMDRDRLAQLTRRLYFGHWFQSARNQLIEPRSRPLRGHQVRHALLALLRSR